MDAPNEEPPRLMLDNAQTLRQQGRSSAPRTTGVLRRQRWWDFFACVSALLLAACGATLGRGADSGRTVDNGRTVSVGLVRDALPIVTGIIAGHPATILLDTGCERTVIASAFAQRIGLPTGVTQVTAVGVGGSVAATVADNVSLQLGRAQSFMQMVVVPIDVEPVLGRELHAVLGRDVFAAFVVEIDYENNRVTFHERESYRYQGPGVTLPVRPGRLGAWSIELEIEDLGPALFEVDTGDGGTLSVDSSYVAKHRLLDGRPHGTGLRAGVGGLSEVVTTRVARIGLGGVVFHDVPIDTDQGDIRTFGSEVVAGRVGGQLLGRYRLVVDGLRRQIHLEPIAERVAAPFPRNRSGLAVTHRGSHLEVLQVVGGSAAAKAGFAVGDRIRAIDGIDVAVGYWDQTWRWSQQPQGTVVTIDLVGGKSRTLVLGEVP